MRVSVLSPEALYSVAHLWNTSALLPTELIRLMDKHVCAHTDVLGVGTSVCQTKHSVTLLEPLFTLTGKLFNGTTELYSHRLRRLRWQRVLALSLHKVHAVETEGSDFDKSFGMVNLWSRDLIDEKVLDWAFAAFDACITLSVSANLCINTAEIHVPTAFMFVISPCFWLEFFEILCSFGRMMRLLDR